MGVGYKRTDSLGDIPVFQDTGRDLKIAQGGFLLEKGGLPDGTIIKAGTPMIFNESTRKAKFLPTGKVIETAASDAVVYKVAKGHTFKVGDNFASVISGKAYAITAINSSNVDYDTITIGTTIGVVSAGSLVFGSSTTGTNNSSFGGVNGLLFRDHRIGDGESCSVVIAGAVYARRVPYSSELATALPRIIYSQSF